MSDFRILTSVGKSMGRFVEQTIDTHMVDDVAHLAASRTTGVTNPIGVLAGVASAGRYNQGIFNPRVLEHTTSRVIRGTGASPLDDAVNALHNLGQRHGVSAINLSDDPNLYGGLMRTGSGHYESGGNILKELGKGDLAKGKEVAFRLDAAARRVLDWVDTPR